MKTVLTIQQQHFIKYYLENLNAAKAYKKAGYKTNHAHKAAYQLLQNPLVKAHIEKYRQEAEKETKVTFNWALNKLKEITELSIYKDDGKESAIKAINEINKMMGYHAA